MKISLRSFDEGDVPAKVRWINDGRNNEFLHYDLPLEEGKTLAWFRSNRGRTDRLDMVIEADGVPVGLIGLLSIDKNRSCAEYYVSMGEQEYKGRGVAFEASRQLLRLAFEEMGLERIYLETETGNLAAQSLFEKLGFVREGLLRRDVLNRGELRDRYAYSLLREEWLSPRSREPGMGATPVTALSYKLNGNAFYVKRDDLYPVALGGNKARKARLFFEELDSGDYASVVTYGSGSSNHCRAVACLAAARGLECLIVTPNETAKKTANGALEEIFGAKHIFCALSEVAKTIDDTCEGLKIQGKKPFFIPGGGHGNTGTQAYVDCYNEIAEFSRESAIKFDYIFFAGGTGTTQAGLVCGKLLRRGREKLVGISIARKNPYGGGVVRDSVNEYLAAKGLPPAQESEICFVDKYIRGGYDAGSGEVKKTILSLLKSDGLPLDETYTGKAFAGMADYIKENGIFGKNILFIHTGGTPLFYDFLKTTESGEE